MADEFRGQFTFEGYQFFLSPFLFRVFLPNIPFSYFQISGINLNFNNAETPDDRLVIHSESEFSARIDSPHNQLTLGYIEENGQMELSQKMANENQRLVLILNEIPETVIRFVVRLLLHEHPEQLDQWRNDPPLPPANNNNNNNNNVNNNATIGNNAQSVRNNNNNNNVTGGWRRKHRTRRTRRIRRAH